MIKLFLFDLGKVLIDFDFDVAIKKLHSFCPVDVKKVETLFRDSSLAKKWDEGLIPQEEFYEIVRKELNLPLEMEQFIPIWNQIFFEMEDSISLARSLKPNYKVIMLSNTNPWHAEYVRKTFQWIKDFDDFITSCDVHVMKPDPRIFKVALERGKVKPSETIYIDDVPENVESARKLGIDALQFITFKKLLNDLKAKNIECEFMTASRCL